MDTGEIALLAVGVAAFALVSRRIERWPLTMPIVFVAFGALCDGLGVVDLAVDVRTVTVLGETALAVILFSDAMRLNVTALRRATAIPARLLGFGLPLTVASGTAIVWLLSDVTAWEAALLAAILAPTDAALGQAVVEDRAVPVRIRQALNVESGLNDGLVLPAVSLFLALSLDEARGGAFWTRFVLRQIGLGVLLGVGIGLVAGWLVARARSAGWMDGVYAQLGTLAVAIATFALAETLEANGFVAAFVAGLVHGSVLGARADQLDEYTEDTGRLLATLTFFLFGNVFVISGLGDATVRIVVCGIALLTVGRMVPVALSLVGTRTAWPTVVFLGWFGPRGLASMLFGLLLFEEQVEGADGFFTVVTVTVVLSVVLHGATAAWGARTYGAWFSSMSHEHDRMAEAVDTPEPVVRWARRTPRRPPAHQPGR